VASFARAARQRARSDARTLFPDVNREIPGDELELLRHRMEVRLLEVGDRQRAPSRAPTEAPLRRLRLVK
jgi:hypothetical protein